MLVSLNPSERWREAHDMGTYPAFEAGPYNANGRRLEGPLSCASQLRRPRQGTNTQPRINSDWGGERTPSDCVMTSEEEMQEIVD